MLRALDWVLVRTTDRLRGNNELALGKIDIAAFREAVVALLALRKALAVKSTMGSPRQIESHRVPRHEGEVSQQNEPITRRLA